MFCEVFEAKYGVYVFIKKASFDKKNLQVESAVLSSVNHSWLVYRDDPSIIIDVVPLFALHGMVYPLVVATKEFNGFSATYGYLPSDGHVYAHWGEGKQNVFFQEVENLVLLFESFLDDDINRALGS
jgi:hypothetical protein